MSAYEALGPQFENVRFQDKTWGSERRIRADMPQTGSAGAVGQLRWDAETGVIEHVSVHHRVRRQGLATELLRRAREVDPNVRHSDNLSDDGEQWAKARP